MTTHPTVGVRRHMLNKVPEVTLYFWIIKILCTTVGESFADYINETLGFGLTNTTLVFSAALIVVLVAQFRADRYVPGIYWARGGPDQRGRNPAHRQPHRRREGFLSG